MYQFVITMEAYDEIAKEVLNKVQLIIWRLRIKAILSILPNKIFNKAKRNNKELDFDKNFDDPYKKVIKEFSEDKKVLEERNKEVLDFLHGDCREYLKKEKEIKALTDDRTLSKLKNKAIKWQDKIKRKAISKVIDKFEVISFFNRMGIVINTEIKKKQ